MKEHNLSSRQLLSAEREAASRIKAAKANRSRELDLNKLGLEVLPDSIGDLKDLEFLSLWQNRLHSLPDSLAQLTNLRTISLGSNKLNPLPTVISRLSSLRTLGLSSNGLTQLPTWLKDLQQLEVLVLERNGLRTLPLALRELKSLRELFLQGNPDLDIPPELLGPSFTQSANRRSVEAAAILDYYFRTHSGETRPLNEAKVILVGRGEVGKTSLVEQLLHSQFRTQKKTEGIVINKWPVRISA